MKKGYVFLSNSTKPTPEDAASRSDVKLTNVSRPCLETALEMGYEVYFGENRDNPEELKCDLPVHIYDAHSYRSILAIRDNYIAYKNLDQIVKENKCDVIHCNTPVGGMVGRLVGKKNHVEKIIYTAHGFHFYKGAPLFNRTVLKFAERVMARWTDAIITMNEEDYQAALKFKLRKGGKVYKVHGVGITLEDFFNVESFRKRYREQLGLSDCDIALISAGDLIHRKNYETAIQAVANAKIDNLHYYICGTGNQEKELKSLVTALGLNDKVHFLGYRTDIKYLLAASDIFIFTTLQEGLPRSMMEAMACGLPCVASKIRGNIDLIKDGVNGFLCSPKDANGFSEAICRLAGDENLRKKMSSLNYKIIEPYDIKQVKHEIELIYSEVINN